MAHNHAQASPLKGDLQEKAFTATDLTHEIKYKARGFAEKITFCDKDHTLLSSLVGFISCIAKVQEEKISDSQLSTSFLTLY